jgi:hypothetical protein
MKAAIAAFVSVAFLAGLAGAAAPAMAKKKHHRGEARYHHHHHHYRSLAERQRHRETFDPNLYYERDSRRIPFGTAAWWRQKEFEDSPGRP